MGMLSDMWTRRMLLQSAALPAMAQSSGWAPQPFGAVPSTRQLQWHERETYAFLHFGINTFTGKEWGYGDEAESVFAPSAFDAEAIVNALASGGMTGLILTCKHHDGFCLWPTKTTDHSIARSAWKDGKGNVVRELSEAARRRGMHFGVYLSPWDRNSAAYGTPAYLELYRRQLRELLTGYGPIFEVWHDGANGGDGFYGGAREKRTIDKRRYYDWPRTWDLVRSLQPDAVIFSDVGPDVRWAGNENGTVNETCWAAYDPVGVDGGPASPGDVRAKDSATGHRKGTKWLPPECDVSIRPGWFWREPENSRVKSLAELKDLYFHSVGRGASFLLNVPPDRRGLIYEADASVLATFGSWRYDTFRTNLASSARATASNVRGTRPTYAASNLLDPDRNTYWATDDAVTTAEVVVETDQPVTFDVVRLREHLRLGQRVDLFAIDAWDTGSWKLVGQGTSIGACRLLRSAAPISANRIRLRILRSAACPALAEFAIFLQA